MVRVMCSALSLGEILTCLSAGQGIVMLCCENALVMGINLSIICSKIMSTVVAHFTACYIFYWSSFFPATQQLLYTPSFDGELMTFLTLDAVQHKRQVDCPVITNTASGPWNSLWRENLDWVDRPPRLFPTVEQQLTAIAGVVLCCPIQMHVQSNWPSYCMCVLSEVYALYTASHSC